MESNKKKSDSISKASNLIKAIEWRQNRIIELENAVEVAMKHSEGSNCDYSDEIDDLLAVLEEEFEDKIVFSNLICSFRYIIEAHKHALGELNKEFNKLIKT